MKLGTKSVLFGAHQFLLHPCFVAFAWWRLYGFPFDPRLWCSFFVHDLGYIGKPNMDGSEGEKHPYFGAKLMGFFFGQEWHDFALYHSRFLTKQNRAHFSKLCVADKMSLSYTPAWLYLPMVRLTGEIHEYMAMSADKEGKYASLIVSNQGQKEWYKSVQHHLKAWANHHKDGVKDEWTPDTNN